MMLLSDFQAPPPIDEIRFGESLALRPRIPRSRRGPVPKSKPFDAAEIYHTDSQLDDMAQWRITALLEALKRAFTWEDQTVSEERISRIERVRRELENRGLDFETLVRYGMASKIAVTIYTTALMSRLVPRFEEGAPPIAARLTAWIPFLGFQDLSPVQWDDLHYSIVHSFDEKTILRITAWVRSASIEEVVDLTPPSEALAESHLTNDEISTRNECAWLFDRFTTTYLWQWALSSMKLEWKYQHGLYSPPCGNTDMATVRISEPDLAKQLAARAVDGELEPSTAGFSANDYVPVALNLLSGGRRNEAAAIFEATASLSPRDPFALNNWGFCLMPDSPDKALELFDRAAQCGLADSLMLIGNRLWCLTRLERYSTALSVADAVIDSLAARSAQTANMWSLTADSVENVEDLRLYVLDLIATVVEKSADGLIGERWKPVLDDARGRLLRSQ